MAFLQYVNIIGYLVTQVPVRRLIVRRDAPHGGHAEKKCRLPAETDVLVKLGQSRKPEEQRGVSGLTNEQVRKS